MELTRDQIVDYLHDNRNLEQAMDYLFNRAKDGKSWACPICANGSDHGDGIKIVPKSEGSLKCFSMKHGPDGWAGDIFNLIGEINNIDRFPEQIERVAQLLGIEIINIDWDKEIRKFNNQEAEINAPKPLFENPNQGENKPEPKKEALEQFINALEEKDVTYKQLNEQSQKRINEAEPMKYLTGRGISKDTIDYFKLGFAENLFVGNRNFEKCIVFPTSNASFSVRDINPNVAPNEKARKPKGKKDIPLGLLQLVAEKDKKYKDTHFLEPIFLVEGLVDAPSIKEAGGDAVAIIGTGNINTFIDIYKYYEIKRPVLIALDQDEAGQQGQRRALNLLQEAEIEAYNVELIPKNLYQEAGIKDANDYLLFDRESLKKAVEESKIIPYMDFLKDFNEFQKEAYLTRISTNRDKIPTGFKTLDSKNYLDGGLDEGLIGIGALSSLGKTAFSLQLADQIATAGHDVIYYSLEMSSHELRDRSISRYTAKDLIATGNISNINTRKAGEKIKFNPYAKTQSDINHVIFNPDRNTDPAQRAYTLGAIDQYFSDTGKHLRIIEGLGNIDADKIKDLVEKHIKFTGRKPVVFIDYLQLLIQPKDENGRRPSMTDKQIVDANIFRLKQISRDFHIPIWIISSFNRESYEREVTMSSFKESGAIEYSADVLIALSRPDQHKPEVMKEVLKAEKDEGARYLRLKILKNRNGRTNETIVYRYYPAYSAFEELGAYDDRADYEATIAMDEAVESFNKYFDEQEAKKAKQTKMQIKEKPKTPQSTRKKKSNRKIAKKVL